MKAAAVSTMLVLTLLGCAGTPPNTLADAVAEAERELDRLQARGLVGQVLILQANRTLVSRGLGTLSPDSEQPVTMDSVMPLASVTKAFTASAVLALAADGELELDDTLGTYLPDLAPAWQAASIRQLLTHSAGMPAELVNPAWDGYPRFEPISRKELIRRLNQFAPAHRPGERFNYSNIGYNVAAALVEVVSGQSPERYLDRRLLGPAGIENLGLAIPDWNASDLVIGRRGRTASDHHFFQPRVEEGMGWLSRGSSDFLARPAAVAAWWHSLRAEQWLPQPWLQSLLEPQLDSWYGEQYGLGLEFRRDQHGPALGHTGSDLDFTVDWSWYPQHELMIYVALADRRWRADQVRDALLEKLVIWL